MFCSNCGHQFNENDLFCPVCGAKNAAPNNTNEQQTVNTQANDSYAQFNAANNMGQQGYTYTQNASPDIAPKKKSKFIKIGIPVGAAIVVLGSVVTLAATGILPNWFRKTFTSPENYFQYVAEKNTDSALTSISKSYSAYADYLQQSSDLNGSVKCTVTLGSSLRNLAGLIEPALGDLENASLQLDINQDTDTINARMLANVNSVDIATVNAHIDIANEEGYLQIPELSNSYLDLSSSLADTSESFYYSNEMMKEIQQYLPDEETLNKLLKRYSDICLNNMTDITKSSKTLEANNVEQKCTTLTINLDGKYAYKTFDDILKELADDQDLKDIITNIDADSYDEFKNNVEDASESLPEMKDDFIDSDANAETVIYLNNQDEVCGIEFNLEINEQQCNINLLMPQDGAKFGYLCNVIYENREYFNINGNGTIKNDILNGDFSVSLDSSMNPNEDIFSTTENILLFKISDYDLKAAKDGLFNGKIEFSTEAASQISDYVLAVTFESDSKNALIKVALLSGREEWLTLTFESAKGEKLPDLSPSESDVCYDVANEEDLQKYLAELNLKKFLTDMTEQTGINLDVDGIASEMQDSLKDFTNYGSSWDYDYNDQESDTPNSIDDYLNEDSDEDSSSDSALDSLLDDLDDSVFDDTSGEAQKTYSSISEFVSSDYIQNTLNTLNETISDDTMTIDVRADGNKMIYSYKFITIEKSEEIANALKEGIDSMSSVFQETADELKTYVAVENPVVVIEYLDKNNSMIYSQEFTGK